MIRHRCVDSKIHAAIIANAFGGLHNDKYTKFQPCNNWAHIVPQYIGWSSRHTNALHLTAGFIMVGYPFEFILIRLIHNIVVVYVRNYHNSGYWRNFNRSMLAFGTLLGLPLETIASTSTDFAAQICQLPGAVPQDAGFYDTWKTRYGEYL
ncbi:MAG: hypothetical protein WCB15_21045 [Desulfobacterales bacterium]|jgi:hypothetical protein